MVTTRFAGPLAAAWPDASADLLARVLVRPVAALPVPPAQEREVWAEPGPDPRSDVRHWRRTARLERHSGRIVVVDDWALDPDPEAAPTHIHLLVAGEVDLGTGRAGITALDGAGHVALTWQPASAPCASTVRVLDDPMLADVWGQRLTRLAIDVTAIGAAGRFVLVVEQSHPHDALHGGIR